MSSDDKKIEALTEDITLLEGYIEDLFSFTPLPLCFVSPKGMVLEINPAFMKLTGYDEYEIVGENISVFLQKDEVDNILKETTEKGELRKEEVAIRKKEGCEVMVVAFAKLRKMKDGGVSGVFLSFFDITEIKKKEEDAREANRKLEEKIEELEKINRLTIGRENKMVELKEKIEKLEKQLEDYKKGGKEEV